MRSHGLILAVIACAVSACQSSTSKTISTADINGMGVVEVRPLTDRKGPFSGQYAQWDEWVIAHLNGNQTAWDVGAPPADWVAITARVTPEGYLVPMLREKELFHEGLKSGNYDYWDSCPFSVQAAGSMDPDMFEDYRQARISVTASYYPAVPDWVANEPPYLAMLFPNGDVVTSGPLGAPAEAAVVGCCAGDKQKWHRYSAAAELLGTTDAPWWMLYHDAKASGIPDGEFHNRKDGYIYFTSDDESQILSAWDWDGSVIEGAVLPPLRDAHNFMGLKPEMVNLIYRAQQGNLAGETI